jgi:hypothetical protein
MFKEPASRHVPRCCPIRALNEALLEYKWKALLTESVYLVIVHVKFCLNKIIIEIKHHEVGKRRWS